MAANEQSTARGVSLPDAGLKQAEHSSTERERLLYEFNATGVPFEDKCIHQLFEEQATRTPEATALVFGNESFTYGELNARANKLAWHLRELGVGPDSLVGVCVERSARMVPSLLAILKAGGAYVPLDPAYPRERLGFMAGDARLTALVTQQHFASTFNLPKENLLLVDDFDWSCDCSRREQCYSQSTENLAYVIYTSGSTGKPKGVMVTHRNAANFFAGMDAVIGRGPGVWLAVTSICFDISVLELFWTLSRGFKVVLGTTETKKGNSIPTEIVRHAVTHFQCTPSLATMLIEEPGGLEALRGVLTVLLGGEPLPVSLAKKLGGAGVLINVYGPTETTVWSTASRVDPNEVITVGRPIANTQIYILDAELQPVPIGVPGEIYIGGAGVTRGYLNRAQLTRERFLPNPFRAGERIYRTGDLGQFLPDGRIECLGRVDFQVKVRGFRIEPGEIENALREHPGVGNAVVIAREYPGGDKRLVAYYSARDGAAADSVALRRFLEERVPDYMVPSAFVALPSLPLTPNGKIDRQALPPPPELTPLTPAERAQIIEEWNATKLSYPLDLCLHQRFEIEAAANPNATAIICDDRRMSYGELNARANQLARYLVRRGAQPDELIGVWLDRTEDLVVALLAVLKSGAAYLPLDAGYPRERLQYMMEDAKVRLLITQSRWLPHVPAHSAQIICLDKEVIADEPRTNLGREAGVRYNPHHLAYVMYTSGSTGRPKGVAIEHASAVAFVHWAREVFTPDELGGTFASTSVCFDLSIFELFAPLSWGGTVILGENVMQLPRLPARDRVTLLNTVPSAAGDLLRAGCIPPSVTTLALAGEPLTPRLVDDLYALPQVKKVYDLYGPSETTTYSTFGLRRGGTRPTIGKPLANTQIYILDADLQPTPVGVPGEICIGGAGLARGYLHNPEATAQKFVANPFRSGARMYRTGDLGRWLPGGEIEFLGRRDHQVKVRGYRIELGEIETAMASHPAVREAAAMAHEDGEVVLAGYAVVAPGSGLTVNEFRHYLREKVPDYMVPSALIFLQAMPRTPSGKIDRKALPKPAAAATTAEGAAKADEMNPIEETLACIWREVIGLRAIGVRDNFFDLGGHSVLVAQVLARVRAAFQVELALRDVFERPTIAELAKLIEEKLIEELEEAPPQPALLQEA
jgi:amino acid adenylation domain-containing protein